jgi:hypothetical protein
MALRVKRSRYRVFKLDIQQARSEAYGVTK